MLDCGKTIKYIQEELSSYIKKNSLKSLILGISGGIDSALCAALARPVCDLCSIPLIGRSIPICTNKQDELRRARLIGDSLCTDFEEKDLSDFFSTMAIMLNFTGEWRSSTGNLIKIGKRITLEDKVRIGNAKARLRMIYLYDLASNNHGMVLSTDNYTEYLLGFWTLHGDVGDYGMIQNLWKTEVYEMANFLINKWQQDAANDKNEMNKEKIILKMKALNECIRAIPTDGLGITNSDLNQLGASSYEEVDKILKDYLKNKNSEELQEMEKHPMIVRHIRSGFKRQNPYNILREIICG